MVSRARGELLGRLRGLVGRGHGLVLGLVADAAPLLAELRHDERVLELGAELGLERLGERRPALGAEVHVGGERPLRAAAAAASPAAEERGGSSSSSHSPSSPAAAAAPFLGFLVIENFGGYGAVYYFAGALTAMAALLTICAPARADKKLISTS